jgi:hypothetical protein
MRCRKPSVTLFLGGRPFEEPGVRNFAAISLDVLGIWPVDNALEKGYGPRPCTQDKKEKKIGAS